MGSTPSVTMSPGLAYYRPMRGLHSRIIHGSVWESEVKQLDLRPTFRATPLSHVTPDKQHNHGVSAAARSAAVDTMLAVVHSSGRTPYHVSMSKSDQRRGDAGDRFVYMSKDLTIPYRYDSITEDDVIILTDVDYYVDMPLFLTEQDNSVLLYTVTPRTVAGKDLDGHFCFRDNYYVESVAGGSTYSHQLWDYGNDHFNVGGFRAVVRWIPIPNPLALLWRVLEWTGRFLDYVRCAPDRPPYLRDRIRRMEAIRSTYVILADFPFSLPIVYPTFVHKTYLCERRALTEHRSLILLQQEVKLRGWGALYAYYFGVDAVPLSRLLPMESTKSGLAFNRILRVEASGMTYSLGMNGDMATSEVPAETMGALVSAWRNSKTVLTRSTVESYLPPSDKIKCSSVTLLDYLRNRDDYRNCPKIYITEPFISFQYSPDSRNFDEDAKLPMHSFMSPLLGPIPVAEICKANEEFTVSERINKVKQKGELKISAALRRHIREYVEMMVPTSKVHSLSPVDVEIVYERQKRPQQRSILDQADSNVQVSPHSTIQSFQKAQVEGKIGAPRNISTVQPFDKMHYAKFMYAVGDYLNEVDFVFVKPSKTPREISLHVAKGCSRADFVSLGDFSKMDGRKSNVGRELWQQLMLRLFRKEHHAELSELIRRSYGNTCYTKHGVKYFQDWSECSGTASTSLSNAQENAFCAYLACRFMGMEPLRAMEQLFESSFTGDDSFMPGIELEKYISAAKSLGHVVEGRVARRSSQDNVDYLSRYFGPNVWFGDPTSCSDIKRRAWGLHATHVRMLTDKQRHLKALEKARSYFLTDKHTPIIGAWATAFVREHHRIEDDEKEPETATRVTDDTSWWGRYPEGEQWIQGDGTADWMLDLGQRQLPDFNFPLFKEWIEAALANHDISKLFNIPCFMAEPLNIDHVDGVIYTNDTDAYVKKKVKVKRGEIDDSKSVPDDDDNDDDSVSSKPKSKTTVKTNTNKPKQKNKPKDPKPVITAKAKDPKAKAKKGKKDKGSGKPDKAGKGGAAKSWRAKDPASSKNGT